MTHDRSILEAALIGYGHQLALIDQAMVELRRRIGSTTTPPAKRTRRPLSVAARARIAAAQRKRWAEHKSATKAHPKKRKLSAAGRKRMVEATKKRWEAFRARKAAAQKAAVKMVKKTKKRSASTDAVSATPKGGEPFEDLADVLFRQIRGPLLGITGSHREYSSAPVLRHIYE